MLLLVGYLVEICDLHLSARRLLGDNRREPKRVGAGHRPNDSAPACPQNPKHNIFDRQLLLVRRQNLRGGPKVHDPPGGT